MDRVDSKGVAFAEKRELPLQRRESCLYVYERCRKEERERETVNWILIC